MRVKKIALWLQLTHFALSNKYKAAPNNNSVLPFYCINVSEISLYPATTCRFLEIKIAGTDL